MKGSITHERGSFKSLFGMVVPEGGLGSELSVESGSFSMWSLGDFTSGCAEDGGEILGTSKSH